MEEKHKIPPSLLIIFWQICNIFSKKPMQFLTMNCLLWIKCTIPPGVECVSKMRDLHNDNDIDDLCHKFYQDFHLDKRGFTFGFGELSVCKINHDGSDDDVKMPIKSNVLLNDFFMPSEDEEHHQDKCGPGQSKEHALLVELPATALCCKSLCCFSFVTLATVLADLSLIASFSFLTFQHIVQQCLAVHHLSLPCQEMRTPTTTLCPLLGPKPIRTKSNTVWR